MRAWPAIQQTTLDGDAAVNDEGLARDPARIVGKEERGRTGDVVRSTESIERVRSRDLALVGTYERGGELCLDHGGGDRIDADGRGKLEREFARHMQQARLARSVCCQTQVRLEAGRRCHVEDHAAVLSHPSVSSR